MSAIEKNQELWKNSEHVTPKKHDCGHCHECEFVLAMDSRSMGPVCMHPMCSRFALGDGRQSPYFGPCPIEGGQ